MEDEEYTRQKYTRDDEVVVPWLIDNLGEDVRQADIGFYTLSTFTVFKNLMRPDDVLKFPEYLYISKNYFHPEWVSHL